MIKKQNGFTLLEIFVALAIGLVLIGGVLSVFVGMKTTTQETSSIGELQENGRFAVTILTDDLLRQNFWGDLQLSFSSDVYSGVDLPPVIGDCIGGGQNNSSFPQGNLFHFRTLWAANVTAATILGGCINNAVPGSDVLQIKRVLARPILPGAIDNERYYLNAGYTQATLFPGSAAAIPFVSNNSRIWEYQHHIYYIRNDRIGTTANFVPVLMQGRLQNTATPISFNLLVEGIERVHYMFGVDTDGDDVVNGYMAPADMIGDYWDNTNNTKILAVKFYVLVRSIRADPNYENNNTYQMGDTVFNAGGDNFRRLLFSSTVTLYNQGITEWQ
ncbi:PilW family protein [Colwellia sp. RE-S-Sl-9]